MSELRYRVVQTRGSQVAPCRHRRPGSFLRSVSHGVSLIEVMIAMLVLLIGLLGMLKLQSDSLKVTYASFQRSVAAVQAMDYLERAWAGCDYGSNHMAIEGEWIDFHDPSRTRKTNLGSAKILRLDGWDGKVTIEPGKSFWIRITWSDAFDNLGFTNLPPTSWHFEIAGACS